MKDRGMNDFQRYAGTSILLLAMCGPAAALIARSYGRAAAGRFCIGMSPTLVAQQALVGLVLARRGRNGRAGLLHQLNLVDLMTLTRGWAASLLVGLAATGIRDRRGVAG